MTVTQKIGMDLAQRGAVPRINAVQGDVNTRVIEMSLYCDGVAWTVPEGVTVSMRYRKPDGTKGVYDTLPDGTEAWSVSGNIITIIMAPQMLAAAGIVLAQIEMILGTDVLATFVLQVNVEQNPAAGALQSEDYVNWLQQMLQGVITDALAEAHASGDFKGEDGQSPEINVEAFVEYVINDSGESPMRSGIKITIDAANGKSEVKVWDGDAGDDGLSMYPTSQDTSGNDDQSFALTTIETSGRTLAAGDLLLTPSGRVYLVKSVGTATCDAVYFTQLIGKQGDPGPAGITQEEKGIMLELFRAATYSTSMDSKLSELAQLWELEATVTFTDSLGTGEFTGTLVYASGMTWGDFVVSDYNIHGLYFSEDGMHSQNGYLVYGYDGSYHGITQSTDIGAYDEYTYDF